MIRGFKRCIRCNNLHILINSFNIKRCNLCGDLLITTKEKCLREFLNNGHSKEVLYAMQKYVGKIPLCPTKIKDNKISCSYIKESIPRKDFKLKCVICQEEIIATIFGLDD